MLYKRIKVNKKRPLLKNASKEELKRIYIDRRETYSTANFKIECNFKNKDQITHEIAQIYEN